MTYISCFIDIGLYLEDSVMYKAVTLAGGIREPLLTCSSFFSLYFFSFFLTELQESNVRLKLRVVDSVGFGDQINKEDR